MSSSAPPHMLEQVCEVVEPEGAFALFIPRPGLALSRVRGHFSEAMARAWIETIEPRFAAGDRYDTLHDWEGMTSYDPGARHLMTKWIVQRRGMVKSARFIASSPVVALGIATAGLATTLAGIELRVCGRREFDEVLASGLGVPVARGVAPVAVAVSRV